MSRTVTLVDYTGEYNYSDPVSDEYTLMLGQLIFTVLPPDEIDTVDVLAVLVQNLLCMAKTVGVKSLDIHEPKFGSCTISIYHSRDYRNPNIDK